MARVEVRPYFGEHGRRMILVDGQFWGIIRLNRRPNEPAEYTFHQRVLGPERESFPAIGLTVTGLGNGARNKSVYDEMLRAAAHKAVARGLLTAPARSRRSRNGDKFRARAKAALAEGTVDAVVRAMVWAKEQ